jgi:ketosteroid isomerase-like protein
MSQDSDALSRTDIEDLLRAFEAGDTATAAAAWAADGVFIDPHDTDPEYRGPEQVREALDRALANVVEQPGLAIHTLLSDHGTVAVEVDTRHVTHDDAVREFRQVFVVESEDNSITRWQAYLPFPPASTE